MHLSFHSHNLLRCTCCVQASTERSEWTPNSNIDLFFLRSSPGFKCAEKLDRKNAKQLSKHPLSLDAMRPIMTVAFPLKLCDSETNVHSQNIKRINLAWYFKGNCTALKCQWIVRTENKRVSQNQRAEACNLSKVPKFRQLIFWLLTAMLQCFAEAKQAPVDNHLFSGGRRGEMEQMAIVLFCCGCFLWIRNALLNAKLCGRAEANECPPAPCSFLGDVGWYDDCCVLTPSYKVMGVSSARSLMCPARG